MLIDVIVVAVLGFLRGLLSLLPWGDAFSLDLSPAFGAMMALDDFLPIHEILTAAGLYIGVVGGLFAFGVLRQVWRFVPVVGGG